MNQRGTRYNQNRGNRVAGDDKWVHFRTKDHDLARHVADLVKQEDSLPKCQESPRPGTGLFIQ